MDASSPAERTAGTARVLMTTGMLFAAEALWRGSVIRALFASMVFAAGGGLFLFARRAA